MRRSSGWWVAGVAANQRINSKVCLLALGDLNGSSKAAGPKKNNRSTLTTWQKRLEEKTAPGVTAALRWRDRCNAVGYWRR